MLPKSVGGTTELEQEVAKNVLLFILFPLLNGVQI
jgi:hypothetical protein